jgi:hypothetical protein
MTETGPRRIRGFQQNLVRNLWRDLQFGLRLQWKNPAFTSVAVLALALGIGANTAIFSVVYATLLAPLPYRQPQLLVVLWSTIKGRNVVSAEGLLRLEARKHCLRGSRCMERQADAASDPGRSHGRSAPRLKRQHLRRQFDNRGDEEVT